MHTVNTHLNSINTSRNMRHNMDNKHYNAFSFHKEQAIINAFHRFLMRYPHESLISNKERQEQINLHYNNALYNRDMASTSVQNCQRFRENVDWNTPCECSHIHYTNPVWIHLICYYLVYALLMPRLQYDMFCSDICTSILDIRWNLYYYVLIIRLYLKSAYHNVYQHIVYKCQRFYCDLTIQKLTPSSPLHPYVRFGHFLFNRPVENSTITKLVVNMQKTISRIRNKNPNRKNIFLKNIFILLTMINMIQFPSGTLALRCYTDVSATKSNSMECGLNTGCVKIYIDSEDMLYRKQTEKGYGYGYKPGKTT